MNKEKLLRIFGNYLDKIFAEVDIQEAQIATLNKSIQEKTSMFTNISNEYDRVMTEIGKEKRNIQGDRNLLVQQKEEINSIKMGLKSKQDEMLRELNGLASDVKELKYQKELLQKDTRNVGVLKTIKKTLEEDISLLRKDYQEMDQKLSDAKKENQRLIAEFQKEVNQLKEEKQTQLDKVIPTIEELEIKRKQLTQREEGLNIIERRYKKLFDEQGKGFKV